MGSSGFSNVRYAMSDGSDGWSEVKPLGEPVKMHFDGIYDNYYDSYIKDGDVGEITMKLEHVNKAFFDELIGRRSAFDFLYKSDVRRMTYPATVRQAKARHKGNRGNRRREYETRVVQCVMYNVRIANETA